MIRVAQIVTRLARRGVPRHVLHIAQGLDQERFEVEVLAGRAEPGEGELWEEVRQRGIRVRLVPSLQRRVSPAADVQAVVALYGEIRKEGYHIVHTHISKAGILGRLAAHLARVPVVLHTYHGVVEEVRPSSLKGRFFLACERRAARWSHALLAVSQDTARQLLDLGVGTQAQYRVVYNGIELERFLGYEGKGRMEGDPVVVAVGSLTREKGMEVLLGALAALREDFPGMRLYLVGDGPLRPFLKRRAQELGVAERVCFAGTQADVRPYLAACQVLVMPSLSEGMGLALVEAMALGRPVVASRVGGIPEVVVEGETGLLVPPGNARQLARALAGLLRNPDQGQRLGQAGQERARQHFGLERMIGELQRLYEELLAARGSMR